ncbi:hypothetical protein GCM10027416_19050 [Okibacterium endophyticum]
MSITDHGPKPFVTSIEDATLSNTDFRATLWTGRHLQVTVMAIEPGGEVGLEKHDEVDQFLRIESGQAKVQMGPKKNELVHEWTAGADDAVFVPAGSWHNLTNTGDDTLKLYSVYGPADHKPGTVQHTPQDPE